MIFCSTYGMNISREQCQSARVRFYLERVCGGCKRGEIPELDPQIPNVVVPPAQGNTISMVRRTGPTIETALREISFVIKTPHERKIGSQQLLIKPIKPRRPCPPDMSPAVWRAMQEGREESC